VYIKKNLKNVIKRYFKIVLLMSKLFLSSGYKRLKVLIRIFHSLNWFQFLKICAYVFTINFYKKNSIYYYYYNPKFKKLSSGYDCFWYMLVQLYRNCGPPRCNSYCDSCFSSCFICMTKCCKEYLQVSTFNLEIMN
jgi:hypothetical protein